MKKVKLNCITPFVVVVFVLRIFAQSFLLHSSECEMADCPDLTLYLVGIQYAVTITKSRLA